MGTGDILVYINGVESGQEITLYHVQGGETCNLTTACVPGSIPSPASALAESEVEAVVYPGPVFRQWVAMIQEVRAFVFATLARRLASVLALIDEITFGKMDDRLASFLLQRFDNEGAPSPSVSWYLPLPPTRCASDISYSC